MSSGQTGIFREQHGAKETTMQVDSSSVLRGGGIFDFSSGTVRMPGNLGRGYIPLVPAGTKTTATASGIVSLLTSGLAPSMKTFEVTSGVLAIQWATANVNPVVFQNVRVPDDLSTAVPLRLLFTAENASAATDDLNWQIRAGTATANLGATVALSTTPIERTVSVASGSVPSSGFIGVTVFPGTHATGTVSLYTAGLSYGLKSS